MNTVFGNPRQFTGLPLVLATLFFYVQIYCDFSGYSDMAVGTARILGYDLTTNFRRPYLARSMAEFWHCWHISLSTWFRDYLYVPLGGNRTSIARWCVNIMVVFILSGLWHGANWTFVIWGVLNGLYLLLERLSATARSRLIRVDESGAEPVWFAWVGWALTFGLISLGWVWFRARSTDDALYVFEHALDVHGSSFDVLFSLGLPRFEMGLALLMITVVGVVEYLQSDRRFTRSRVWGTRTFRWAVYALGTYAIVFFGVFQRIQFVYFQF